MTLYNTDTFLLDSFGNYTCQTSLKKIDKLSEVLLLKDTLRKTREVLAGNFDKKDPEFISLKEELERLFKKKKLSEVSQEEMNANIGALNKIHEKIKELNRQNNLLSNKYNKRRLMILIDLRLFVLI